MEATSCDALILVMVILYGYLIGIFLARNSSCCEDVKPTRQPCHQCPRTLAARDRGGITQPFLLCLSQRFRMPLSGSQLPPSQKQNHLNQQPLVTCCKGCSHPGILSLFVMMASHASLIPSFPPRRSRFIQPLVSVITVPLSLAHSRFPPQASLAEQTILGPSSCTHALHGSFSFPYE